MARRKIPLYDNIKRAVEIETEATKGAQIGTDLLGPDGSVLTLQQLIKLVGGGQSTAPGTPGTSVSYWSLIQEIPANIQLIAALGGDGYLYRAADGSWRLRQPTRVVRNFSYGDAPHQIFLAGEGLVLTALRWRLDVPFNVDGSLVTITAGAATVVAAGDVSTVVVAGYDFTPDAALAIGEAVGISITPGPGVTTGSGRIIIETIPTGD